MKVVRFPGMILVMLGERSRYSDTLIFSEKNEPYAIVVLSCGICLRVSKALTTNRMGSLQKQFSRNQGVMIGRFDPSLYITLHFSLWCSRVGQGSFFGGGVLNFHKLVIWVSKHDTNQTGKPNPPICSLFSWPHDSQKFAEGAVKTTIAYNPIFHMRWLKNSVTMFPPHVCHARNVNVLRKSYHFPMQPLSSRHPSPHRATHCALPERHNAPGPCFWPGSCRDAQIGYVAWGRGQLGQTWSQQIDFPYF